MVSLREIEFNLRILCSHGGGISSHPSLVLVRFGFFSLMHLEFS